MLIKVALPAVLVVIMFSLGLGLRREDFTRVALYPKPFALGAFNQVILLPVVGFLVAILFALPPALAVGVMILALCPGGVLSNMLTSFGRGSVPLSVSLTAVISLLSILTLPVATALSVAHFMGADAPPVDIFALGLQTFLLTAVPVGLAMLLTAKVPKFVELISNWIRRIAFGLFVILIALALAANWGTFIANIGTLGPALLTMNAALLTLGVVTSRMAGLSIQETTTVAIESGIQNGTLGIAVGGIVAGVATGLPEMVLPTAIYSVTTWALSIPFVLWRRRLAA